MREKLRLRQKCLDLRTSLFKTLCRLEEKTKYDEAMESKRRKAEKVKLQWSLKSLQFTKQTKVKPIPLLFGNAVRERCSL